jgi:hypothetical protein
MATQADFCGKLRGIEFRALTDWEVAPSITIPGLYHL